MATSLMDYIATHHKGNVSAFARAVGLTPGRVHHWLKGIRHVPGREAKRLSQKTGLPLEAVLLPHVKNGKRRPTGTHRQ